MGKFFQNLITSIVIGVVVYFFIFGMVHTQALAGIPILGDLFRQLTPTQVFAVASLFSITYFCIYGLGTNGKAFLAAAFLFLMVMYFLQHADQFTAKIQQFADAIMSVM